MPDRLPAGIAANATMAMENVLLMPAAKFVLNPDSYLPPSTDRGVIEPIWYSFDLVHRRIQDGGWTSQVTAKEFPLSQDIAGVTMRLTAGSYRELHWHSANQ